MSTLVTRSGKGSPLTHNEVDTNFTNLNTDKVEKTAADITGGTINNTTIGATTPSTGVFTTLTATGQTSLGGVAGAEGLRVLNVPSSTRYIQVNGSVSSNVFIEAIAPSGNVGFVQTSRGTGTHAFATSSVTSNVQAVVSHTASAVNYVQVTGAATGSSGGVAISAQGSDANVNLGISSKSNGSLLFNAGGTNRVAIDAFGGVFLGVSFSGGTALKALAVGSQVNFIQAQGSVTGFGPILSAQGSDTNIPLVLQPKGTGALQAQQTDSNATGGNARGANAVDWQTARGVAGQVASGAYSSLAGGIQNTSSGYNASLVSGYGNTSSGYVTFVGGGQLNTAGIRDNSAVVGGHSNTAAGYYNFVGGGFTNSGTSSSAVTTQSATMNGTTAVTLSGSNASIKVGQLITGTSIASYTYVAAISGTSLTLSQAASGSSTSTLSFYTPHGVVVGGGNNQATGSYSFIGGGGDAGTAANRNVASGAWSVVVGGWKNTASGIASFVGGGGNYEGTSVFPNTASGNVSVVVGGINNTSSALGSFIGGGYNNVSNSTHSVVMGGVAGTTRGISANHVFAASSNPISGTIGVSQAALLILGRQTTDATATVLASDNGTASTVNQVILPNNSAYYFKVEIIANVTGGGNTSGWELKGVIKRGANAASTAIVGSVTSTLIAQDAGASTWVVSATADTTNGGLKITVTGQASTTIRWVAKASTTEVTF